MYPIEFKEAKYILQKPQNFTEERCEDLPIYYDKNQCVSCWKVTFKERLSILLFGKVWVGVYSPTKNQPPIWLQGEKTVFIKKKLSWLKRLFLEITLALKL